MQKPQILIFAASYLPDVGGAEIAIQKISESLRGEFVFSLITPRYHKNRLPQEKIGAVTVYRVGLGLPIDKFLLPVVGIPRAISLLKTSPRNILWAVMASYGGLLATLVKVFQPEVKLCLTLQEGDEESHLYRHALGSQFLYNIFIRPWYRLIHKKADVLTVISNWLKERAEKNGATAEIFHIPNGVDTGQFEKEFSKEGLMNIFQKHKLPDHGVEYIITTSRLAEKNGVGDSIKALQYMPYKYHLLILGAGELESELKTLTSNLSLNERVHFLGHIPHEDIPKYLKISSIFVRPSRSEGMGNSFIEAMVAGLPVIATPVGGIVDFLEDQETGLFCRVGEPKTIANALHLLERNTELKNKIIENAKKRVLKEYSWQTITPKMKKVFISLL